MTQKLRVGRYETLRPLAAGGMATVYLGRSRGAAGFERHVAIKVMHPHLASDQDFVTMFLDEARMAANLRHPNVVPTLDVAQDAGGLFLVMEFIDGPSLSDMQRALRLAKQPMPMPVALRIVLDMLAGLHAAHELTTEDGKPMNLVHRDVSPHNVLVGKEGVARIMDFGIARAETRIASTRGRTLKGKIPYMAPERLRAQEVDRRVDIYAVGVVLWELLVGRRMFRSDDEVVLITLALDGPQQSPCELNHEVPVPINSVCMKALAHSPDDRYQTAAEFAEALEVAADRAGARIATPRAITKLLSQLPTPPPRKHSYSDGALGSGSASDAVAIASGSRERIDAPGAVPPPLPSDSGVSAASVPSDPGARAAPASVPSDSLVSAPSVPSAPSGPVVSTSAPSIEVGAPSSASALQVDRAVRGEALRRASPVAKPPPAQALAPAPKPTGAKAPLAPSLPRATAPRPSPATPAPAEPPPGAPAQVVARAAPPTPAPEPAPPAPPAAAPPVEVAPRASPPSPAPAPAPAARSTAESWVEASPDSEPDLTEVMAVPRSGRTPWLIGGAVVAIGAVVGIGFAIGSSDETQPADESAAQPSEAPVVPSSEPLEPSAEPDRTGDETPAPPATATATASATAKATAKPSAAATTVEPKAETPPTKPPSRPPVRPPTRPDKPPASPTSYRPEEP